MPLDRELLREAREAREDLIELENNRPTAAYLTLRSVSQCLGYGM